MSQMTKKDDKKADIEIIINGTGYGKMSFPEGINLAGLRDQVLDKTNNTAQPPENWDVKDPEGNLLDLSKHLQDYIDIKQLWLTLKAGIGG
jgi:hypothetical protein